MPDIAGKLFPNLTTLIVQLLSTGVLLLIFKKFLWKNVMEYFAKRADYIESTINEAKEMNEKASTNLETAEKDKLEVAGKLSEALKVEGEAAKESELPFTFGGETVSVVTGNDNSELRRDIQVLQEQVKEYEQRIDELEEGGNRSPNVEAPRDYTNWDYNGVRYRNDKMDPALRTPRNLDNLFNEQENNTAVHEGQYSLIGQIKDFESNLRSALKTYEKFAEVSLKIKTLEEVS